MGTIKRVKKTGEVTRVETTPRFEVMEKGESKKGTYVVYTFPEDSKLQGTMYLEKGVEFEETEFNSEKDLTFVKDTKNFKRYDFKDVGNIKFGSLYFPLEGDIPKKFILF